MTDRCLQWYTRFTSSGNITIDGVNTAGLGLRKLRRGLGIIPQDPVLLSGCDGAQLLFWGRDFAKGERAEANYCINRVSPKTNLKFTLGSPKGPVRLDCQSDSLQSS